MEGTEERKLKKPRFGARGIHQVLLSFYAAACPRKERIIMDMPTREEQYITISMYTFGSCCQEIF